ncbi:MAG: SpoIIIAH-like family protein [Hespellia sp.]|nr:SpoIIIAH-like family protein [Hespellia sp.]
MKRLLKRNQIIIAALAVMIIVAGYLNYSGRLFSKNDSAAKETSSELANQELLDISEEDLTADSEDIKSTDSDADTPGDAVLTSSDSIQTIAQAKVSREQVRAQNKETLQAIIDNTDLTDEEKTDAVAEMVSITKQAEQEMAIETLLASKGFSNAVVNLTADSADVVVESSELTEANRAQIEDVVTRKSEIAPENIVITPVGE